MIIAEIIINKPKKVGFIWLYEYKKNDTRYNDMSVLFFYVLQRDYKTIMLYIRDT